MTTSRALLPPWSAMAETGMPRPLSDTVHEPSGLSTISTRSQYPARASSTLLSTSS